MANQELEPYNVPLDDILDYLDELRESGVTNMFGATPYIQKAFDLPKNVATKALTYWMRTFEERHSK